VRLPVNGTKPLTAVQTPLPRTRVPIGALHQAHPVCSITKLRPANLALRSARFLRVFYMAGLGTNLVQVFSTGRANHWEFLRLWTSFELSSSWRALPCYGASLNRNILDFMSWHQIDLGEKDINEIQRPKSFQKIAGSQVLDEYYNSYLRK
jgi:hypothetical protein